MVLLRWVIECVVVVIPSQLETDIGYFLTWLLPVCVAVWTRCGRFLTANNLWREQVPRAWASRSWPRPWPRAQRPWPWAWQRQGPWQRPPSAPWSSLTVLSSCSCHYFPFCLLQLHPEILSPLLFTLGQMFFFFSKSISYVWKYTMGVFFFFCNMVVKPQQVAWMRELRFWDWYFFTLCILLLSFTNTKER